MTGFPYSPGPIKADHSINVALMSTTGNTSVLDHSTQSGKDPLPWTLDDISQELSWQQELKSSWRQPEVDGLGRMMSDGVSSSHSFYHHNAEQQLQQQQHQADSLRISQQVTNCCRNMQDLKILYTKLYIY